MNAGRWQPEFAVALRAVRDGVLLARDVREHVGSAPFVKADRSPVTVADFAVQALVARRLAQAFPDDPLVAEEDAAPMRAPDGRLMLDSVLAVLRRARPDLDSTRVLEMIDRGSGAPGERFWTLDPIDGTQGFVRGDQYVVALALVVGAHVEIGLLGCPGISFGDRPGDAGSIACAIRNCGAFRASVIGDECLPLHVSLCHDPRTARVLRSFEADHIDLERFNAIVRTLKVETAPMPMDSQAKHALIAAGRAELLLRIPAMTSYRDKIWDQAAGSLIVEEAGGRVTDLRAAPLDFGAGRVLTPNEGVVASNGVLHAAVLHAVRDVMRRA